MEKYFDLLKDLPSFEDINSQDLSDMMTCLAAKKKAQY